MTSGGICDHFAYVQWCAHLATLHHFDHKVLSMVKMARLIPCERRLAEMEISKYQEATFRARFGNGDYDRPYRHFLATLRHFD